MLAQLQIMGDDLVSTYKTSGIVIKVQDFKENDKLVYIFTEKLGKIKAIAKGSKRNRSSLLTPTMQLCFGEYVIFKGKNLYTINEAKVINSFGSLLNDLEKLTYSTYICELIDIAVVEEESNASLFKDFTTCLYLLSTGAINYEILIRAFEIRLLKYTGYDLELEHCSICKKKISTSNYINLTYGGGVCDECEKMDSVFLSKASFNSLKFLSTTSFEKLYRLTLSENIRKELYKILTTMISLNYARTPKSLQMLEFIK